MTSLVQFDTLCFTGGLHQTTGTSLQPGTQAYPAIISSNDGTIGVQAGSVGTQLWAFTPIASPHGLQTVDITGNTYPFFGTPAMGRGGMALSSTNAVLIGSGQALFAYTGESPSSYPSPYALAATPNAANIASIAFLPSTNIAVVATDAGFFLASVTPSTSGGKPTLNLTSTPVNPTYQGSDGKTYAVDHAQSVAITQDGKFLVALTNQPSQSAGTLVVLPISTTGTIGTVSATVSGLLATSNVDSIFAY